MKESAVKYLSVEEIFQRIKQEIQKRKGTSSPQDRRKLEFRQKSCYKIFQAMILGKVGNL